MLNAMGRGLEAVGIRPVRLDQATLLSQARRRSGLSDFGDEGFQEPLRILLQAIEQEAELTLMGRWMARWEIRNHLENRLRVIEVLKRLPEIAGENISAPIFITGSGRSGTSILHELLARDPRHRALRHWEALFPCPLSDTVTHDGDPRIPRAQRDVDLWERIAPAYRTMHQGGADAPQECDYLLNLELMSDHISGAYQVPSYARWLARADRRAAYAMHRNVLQILQWQAPTRQWVLKAPSHLGQLETLFAVYPDARVVQTHRDPLKVLASMTSLVTTLYWLRSDRVDPRAVAAAYAKGVAHLVNHSLEQRDSGLLPEERFCDVRYVDFQADPIQTVRGVYERFGMTPTPEAETAMRAHLATRRSQPAHRGHRYAFEDTGLDALRERERFRAYQERFGIPSEL
jgi:hypothetical protein